MMKKVNKVETVAISRYVRISPFKVRRILDQIRGRSYDESVGILSFMPYKACPVILNTLRSAAANAKNRYSIKTSSLIIKEARADSGPTLKRFRPHAQGRGFPIKKRMSHIISKI
jgi:large subunit ribosomal protein L22